MAQLRTPIAPSKVIESHRAAPANTSLVLAPSPEIPIMLARDTVTVANEDSKSVRLAWDGDQWTLKPGDVALVPFQAVVRALGDPRSGDKVRIFSTRHSKNLKGFVATRHDELVRLCGLYGVRNENIDRETAAARRAHSKDDHTATGDEPISLVKRTPKLSVRTNQGVELKFPGNVPDMIPTPSPAYKPRGAVVQQATINDDSENRIAALEAQNARLEKLITDRLGGGSDVSTATSE